MFILYAVAVGLVLGLVTAGSPGRLGRLELRWWPLVAVGMLAQLALFSSPVGNALGPIAPIVYLASNGLVLAAVARNLAIPGLPLVLLGGASNVLAIVANGGYMPVSPEALAAMGRGAQTGYSNSRLVADVQLMPLTDIFAMPTWIPTANVFSIGDVLIGVGVAMAVIATMHGRSALLSERLGPVRPDTDPQVPGPA
jgi:Family of unknown function (DUF5317)